MLMITLGVMTTTAQRIEGRPVGEYFGVVAADSVVVIPSQTALSPARSIGGALVRGQRDVIDGIARQANARGATAVVDVSVVYIPIGPGHVIVSAAGTAVRL